MESKKYNEKIIIRDGKLVYGIQLVNDNSKNYITIRSGEIYFTDNWYSSVETFDFNDEAHKIAKEIFIQQLQTDIKSKISELKLLEEVFKSINLQECIGTIIPDSSKILLEAKKDIEAEITKQIKEKVEPIHKNMKQEVEKQIEETVKPIARKRKKKEEEDKHG